MKTPINFLKVIFSLSIVALLLISWTKESPVLPIGTATASFDPGIDFIAEEEFDTAMTFERALESINTDAPTRWGVAIKAFTCIRNGQTLLVYNPNALNLDFYNSSRFSIHWFKDGRPVRGDSVRLDCVCKGNYAAFVIDKRTQQGVGVAKYSARACFENAVGPTNK